MNLTIIILIIATAAIAFSIWLNSPESESGGRKLGNLVLFLLASIVVILVVWGSGFDAFESSP